MALGTILYCLLLTRDQNGFIHFLPPSHFLTYQHLWLPGYGQMLARVGQFFFLFPEEHIKLFAIHIWGHVNRVIYIYIYVWLVARQKHAREMHFTTWVRCVLRYDRTYLYVTWCFYTGKFNVLVRKLLSQCIRPKIHINFHLVITGDFSQRRIIRAKRFVWISYTLQQEGWTKKTLLVTNHALIARIVKLKMCAI